MYLSPEPLLQKPNWVLSEALQGYSTPTYAYARNNPIKYTDPDGLAPCTAADTTFSCCVKKAIENGKDPVEACAATASEVRKLLQCEEKWTECAMKCGNWDPQCADPVGHPVKTAQKVGCMLGCNLELAACYRNFAR